MWTCAKCTIRNWGDAKACQGCGRSPEGRIVFLTENSNYNSNYTVTLAPGVVRYFSLNAVLADDIEELIVALRKLSAQPQINKVPQAALDVDAMFLHEQWDHRLRMHHQQLNYLRLCKDQQVPSVVYECFRDELGLKLPEFGECMKSWVSEAWSKQDVAESYAGSSKHLIVGSQFGPCVFFKTPFVENQLSLLADEAKRKAEERRQLVEAEIERQRKEEVARKTTEDSERLRRSKFKTYVYVMEDLRNGRFKIGRSATPNKRERTLQSEAPEVVLRLSIPADENDEKNLHCHFASKRVRGEWFELEPHDLVWITTFLKQKGDFERASIDYQWLGTMFFRSSDKSKSP
jgi:hypothetical protein